jgi:hypothetical protein
MSDKVVQVDSRKRVTLGSLVEPGTMYIVKERDGRITLVPAAIVPLNRQVETGGREA